MSNDWSNDPGSDDEFGGEQSPWESPNTTDPGEPEASWETDPNNYDPVPMGKAKITDVFNNFSKVVTRAINSGVVGAYAALIIGQFVVTFGGAIALVALTAGFSSLDSFESGFGAAGLGAGVFVGMGVLMLFFLGVQLFVIGLFNPIRAALFEGMQPHHGFGWAFSKASENLLAIFVTLLAYMLLMGSGFLLFFISEYLILLWVPFVFVGAFLLHPAVYYAATGHGVAGAFSKAVETVTNNMLLFVIFIAVCIGVGLMFACVNLVLNFIPILGGLAGLALNLLANALAWSFYVALLTTIESHELGRPIS